jgi:hypothetical protein
MPGQSVYTDGMNSKQRYRRRLKVQVALLRVVELLIDNYEDGIPPDRTTALMAWAVTRKLVEFVTAAKVDKADLPQHFDITRFAHLKRAKLKEKAKRDRRRGKQPR